jgi:RNA 3'-terminal phosphate cyclase (ATP)
MLTLDGSQGEGGGQILRTSLALSMCTGTPFRIERIRANRKKPGLMRQHLAAVLASAEVSSARVTGAQIGSQTLTFAPDRVRGGEYRFATASAGSCTLVLQTILPALLQASTPSTVTLQGGTHNPMAPPYPFLERAFAPVLRRMGANITLKLNRHGFYPAGGGEIAAAIEPVGALGVIDLSERGERVDAYAESLIAALAGNIAQRELAAVSKALGWKDAQLFERNLPRNEGPGNSLHVTLVHRNVTEVFSAFGELGVTSEAVAKQVVEEVRSYLASDGAVGGHLADQLLVPMALAGAGTFTTSDVTPHLRTNAEVIGRFLPVETDIVASGRNSYAVTMRRRRSR